MLDNTSKNGQFRKNRFIIAIISYIITRMTDRRTTVNILNSLVFLTNTVHVNAVPSCAQSTNESWMIEFVSMQVK